MIFGLASPALAKTKGNLQIGFTGTIVGASGQPAPRFKNVYLNIQQVRVNQNSGAGANGGGWQVVPTPFGIAQQQGGQPADLQIDLNNIQNLPILFNSSLVKATTYKLVEVDVDTSNPGSIVPLCANGGGGSLEGCAPYKILLQGTGGLIFPIPGSISVAASGSTSYVVNLALQVVSAPTASNNAYVVNITTSQANPQNLGTVQGTVPAGIGLKTNVKGILNPIVTAEIAGTNTFVSQASVSSTDGTYLLQLPAAENVGSLYDIYLSGGGLPYAAQRLAPLLPGNTITQNFDSVTAGQKVGTISGNITDPCDNAPIPGATVQVLMPSLSAPVDCTVSPGQCISVAVGSAANTGAFPAPGQTKVPAPFENIPLPSGPPYALEVSAPGYDTIFTTGVPTLPLLGAPVRKGGTCGPSATACNFALTSGEISGTVTLSAVPTSGQTVLVQVFAEQQGTNNLVGALQNPLIFRNSTAALPFTMTIPTGPAMLDLYATAIDLFQGRTDPYTGHTIIVQSNVHGFGGTVPSCTSTPVPTNSFVEEMDCTGHGAISGLFANSNTNTSARLSKQDTVNTANFVQLLSSGVGPTLQLNPPQNPTFAFCAPGDTYSVQRYDVPVVAPGTTPAVTPTPMATGSPVSTTIPTPVPTASSTACPTTCFNNGGTTCPGICDGVVLPSPL